MHYLIGSKIFYLGNNRNIRFFMKAKQSDPLQNKHHVLGYNHNQLLWIANRYIH
jgi:hypothetical protein